MKGVGVPDAMVMAGKWETENFERVVAEHATPQESMLFVVLFHITQLSYYGYTVLQESSHKNWGIGDLGFALNLLLFCYSL